MTIEERLLAARKKWLEAKPPACPNCTGANVKITWWNHYPSMWFCNICREGFLYEPGPKDIPLRNPASRFQRLDWHM